MTVELSETDSVDTEPRPNAEFRKQHQQEDPQPKQYSTALVPKNVDAWEAALQ
ncbi:hypothetical protein GQ53DRAFT_742006 [Thozetella sp. PMI_491]|nr:hypothetical protein GQ53DRAFT_742006 [Thozetella sp. PMI_491]